MTDFLLNFKQVAEAANIDRTTLYQWERSGRFKVKPFDDHKPRRWHRDDIAAWLAPNKERENDQPRLAGI
jgi:predicted site-specific integrase-resolvase